MKNLVKMKNIKHKVNRYAIFMIASIMMLFSSCDTTELDLTVSPNTLTPESGDPDFILNQIQIDLNRMFGGVRDEVMPITRLINMFDAYPANIDVTTFDTFAAPNDQNVWFRSYRINGNRKVLADLAASNPDLIKHKAVAGLIASYTFVTLTDILGDIPFSEANNPNEFPSPSPDGGAEIYESIFTLIDESLSELSGSTANTITQDLYYNGDLSKWIKFGNTLKLKMYNQLSNIDATRAAAGINDVIANGSLLETVADDFQFQFLTSSAPGESRHDFFTDPYLGGGASVTLYMSNSFMRDLKETNDPRLRYYFYRQSLTDPTGDDLPCNISQDECYIGDFYWGRVHAFSQGVPADNLARTIYGVYPGGGKFDNNPFTVNPGDPTSFPGVQNPGLGGAGINPILLSSYAKFIQAEAAISLGTTGNPRTLLEEGTRNHIMKVMNFGAADAGDLAPDQTDVDSYVASVLADYDAATDDNGRLAVVLNQYYIANYGNGIEAYNFYRKTGLPELQDPISPSAFPRSLLVPSNEITANPNVTGNQLTDQVFWDNNPATGFID